MTALRVLLTAHRCLPEAIGGVERIVEALGRDLPRLGDTVTIVARRPGADQREEMALLRERLGDRCTLFRLTGPTGGYGQMFLQHARLEQLYTSVLLETAPDVAHFLHLLHLSPAVLEIAYRQRVPIVVSLQDFYFACPLIHLRKPAGELCHGPNAGQECAQTCFAAEGAGALQRWAVRALYFRRLLDLADAIVCPSQFVADFFVRQQGLRPEQVRVVPNGIVPMARPARASLSPRERGRLRLAFQGAVCPHKGVHVLLKALELAELPAVQLDINGTIHDFPDYVEGLRQMGKRIPGLDLRINGPYDLSSVPRLLQAVDCVVVPSQWPETFALVSREALAQGVPILVAHNGGLPEAIEPGVNGLTFEPDQPAELAGHLRAIWEDEALLNRLSRGAVRSAVMLTPEHAQRMHDLYSEVIDTYPQRQEGKAAIFAEVVVLRRLLMQLGFS